ncbi:60S ribosomal protein L27-3 [Platanthera guangdongensis]|uniref:60S ribosomal protein L27-3 n=1 Tax=Platanthera guangdongensis TaxID=2320717 RepID=A0ABR2LS61_9ASPA
MVKFLKPDKVVIVLNGRFAGRKAVIVWSFDEGMRDRPYDYCLVTGIAKYPKKVIRKDSAKKMAKKSRVKAFLELDVVTLDSLQSRDKNITASKETKERFKSGKNSLPPWLLGGMAFRAVNFCFISPHSKENFARGTQKLTHELASAE